MKNPGLLPCFRLPAPPRTPARFAAVSGMLPRRGFESALGRQVELLSGTHMMITLFAVDPAVPLVAELEKLITEALAPLGSVGRLPDGRIGLLYLGPNGAPVSGSGWASDGEDDASRPLHDYIRQRIERRLADRGWRRQAQTLRLAAVAGWSDGIREASDLIEALPPPRARPGAGEPIDPAVVHGR